MNFTIIVPTRNRASQLANCLSALARLDYPRHCFEVIVVDDASEMPLEDVFAALPRDLNASLLRQAHAGPAAARNLGARHARGIFLAFTDDDCAPAAGWLIEFEKQLHACPEKAFGGGTVNALPANSYSTASQMLLGYLYTYYNSDPDHARFFTSNNFAVSREAFLALEGFDPSFQLTAEDRDFCDRWIYEGRTLTFAPAALVEHSHALTFGTFFRQHWTYGRGAFHFHEVRGRRKHTHLRLEPASFYFDLARYPFSQLPPWGAAKFAGLLILTQIANAAGFGYEWMQS